VPSAAPSRDLVLRWVTAGPLTLIAAVVTMAAAPLWFPKGAAGIDNLVFPLLLFPLFWAVYVFYSLIEPKPLRGLAVVVAVVFANALLIWRQF
jgi:hypothetical protein